MNQDNSGGGKTWAEKCKTIEDAFRSLPIYHPSADAKIPYEQLIPGMGRQLLMIREPVRRAPASVSKVRAKKELSNLAKKAEALNNAVGSLSKTASSALNFRLEALRNLQTTLNILIEAATTAEVPETPDNAGLGAPEKVQARKTTWIVAHHYLGLTGKMPTLSVVDGKTGGQFFELVATVFGILGFTASAESQAKAVVKDIKRLGSPREWPPM